MALRSYIFGSDYKSPCVIATGHPRNPQNIAFKQFRKGQVIQAKMQYEGDKPSFLLYKSTFVIPLSVIKELVTKDIVQHNVEQKSAADGGLSDFEAPKKKTPPKIKIMDAAIFGGVVGILAVYIAEKQGWIGEPNKKNKIYGGVAGAALAAYVIYRSSPRKAPTTTIRPKTK